MNHSNNHLRQNILTEQWVIYSPQRARRPEQTVKPKPKESKSLPERSSQCPFCPGNESVLPRINDELKTGRNDKWFTRVIPNKYPALTTEEDVKGGNYGIYLTASGFGRHEVIIESPFHNTDIPLMSGEQVRHVLATYVQQYNFLLGNIENILNIIIFRNHGSASGTSLIHPHSQIIGTAIIPKYIHDKESIAEKYYNKKGHCPLCDIVDFDTHDEKRRIFQNDSFLASVPFASEVPFEVWILPKRHSGHFGQINEGEMTDLAEALKKVLSVYYEKLDNPDYNYIIHSCSRQKHSMPYLHWYLQIRPRIIKRAGFEIGSGVHINPSLPEGDAEILRGQINAHGSLESNKIETAK